METVNVERMIWTFAVTKLLEIALKDLGVPKNLIPLTATLISGIV